MSWNLYFANWKLCMSCIALERTFWEKATILHHEANRPEHLEMPQRYSRHYYDLYRMAAYNNIILFSAVVASLIAAADKKRENRNLLFPL